jgi:glycosyltransferase involved in cell wall biosynthesis
LSEVVGEAGLKFPVGKPDLLAARLEKVLSDRSLANFLEGAARARATETFSLEKMIEKHASLYYEVSGR